MIVIYIRLLNGTPGFRPVVRAKVGYGGSRDRYKCKAPLANALMCCWTGRWSPPHGVVRVLEMLTISC